MSRRATAVVRLYSVLAVSHGVGCAPACHGAPLPLRGGRAAAATGQRPTGRAVRHLEEFRFIIGAFVEAGVPITINTDGTYLCGTNLRREFSLIEESRILTAAELETIRQRAFDVSFIPKS